MIDVNIHIRRAQSILNREGVNKDVTDFYQVKENRDYLMQFAEDNLSSELYYPLYFTSYDFFIDYLGCSIWCAIYHHYKDIGDKKPDTKADQILKEFETGIMKVYKSKNKKSLSSMTIFCIETCF